MEFVLAVHTHNSAAVNLIAFFAMLAVLVGGGWLVWNSDRGADR